MQTSRHNTRHGRSIWAWPIALNTLTVSGLVSALLSDGLGDAWAWLALGVPLALMAWLSLRGRR